MKMTIEGKEELSNKEDIMKKIEEEMSWLQQHQEEDPNIYEEKQKEVEEYLKSFMGESGVQNPMNQEQETTSPNIEEID